jgi:hypothetical protein
VRPGHTEWIRSRAGGFLVAATLALCLGAVAAPSVLAAPPANDNFANAEELTGTADTATGTNVEATGETGEPENQAGVDPGKTVWYRWTAPDDLDVSVDTCGSGYDTVMAVFEGATLATLDHIVENDDSLNCPTQSELTFEAEQGTTYSIVVDGFWGGGNNYAEGAIDLELTTEPADPPPPGPAETFYVRIGGTGTDCTEAAPCATIAEALDAHRATSGPGDVIDVGQGVFPENVEANDELDGGLTIRGAVDGSGSLLTDITGAGGGANCAGACVVALGAEGAEVTLRDINVSNDDAGINVDPIVLEGGSDLVNVDAWTKPGSFTAAIVEVDDQEPGTVISDSFIDARNGFPTGIQGSVGVTVRDSQVYGNYQAVRQLSCGCTPDEGITIVRSHLDTSSNVHHVIQLNGDMTLDSSLITGGGSAIRADGGPGELWQINNTTIDAGEAGVSDPVSAVALAVFNYVASDAVSLEVNSSILVEPIFATGNGAGSIACAFSDIRVNDIGSSWTDDCQPGADDNTTSDPADLFRDAPAEDWNLKAGSPAIDAGEPGPVPAGFSQTDLIGDPRRQAGTTATCPDGVRDQGAFEAAGVICPRTLTVTTAGTGTGTVIAPGIDCGGPGHTDCSETFAPGTMMDVIATPATGSSFGGFSGGGCSTSPCIVTLDTDKSVQATFTKDPEPPPTIAKLTITGVALDRDAGTATLTVEATVSGTVAIAKTNKVKATDAIPIAAGGTAELEVAARGNAARKLQRRGRVTVNPRAVLYLDAGGQVGERRRVTLRHNR